MMVILIAVLLAGVGMLLYMNYRQYKQIYELAKRVKELQIDLEAYEYGVSCKVVRLKRQSSAKHYYMGMLDAIRNIRKTVKRWRL